MSGLYTNFRKQYPRAWRIWYVMQQRCDGRCKHYRTVSICKDWSRLQSGEQGFINFCDDMQVGPATSEDPNLEIDRINVKGHYTPRNCRWATRTINNQNKLIYHTAHGKALNLMRQNGIARTTFYYRINQGWSLRRAATEPAKRQNYSHTRRRAAALKGRWRKP